jgi:hypothetical protein
VLLIGTVFSNGQFGGRVRHTRRSGQFDVARLTARKSGAIRVLTIAVDVAPTTGKGWRTMATGKVEHPSAAERRAQANDRGDQTPISPWVPVRHGRIRVSPFTFHRGTARMAGLSTQLCGDAYLSNFGLCIAEAGAVVRPERLRRDAAGPIRVQRQAHVGKLRDRGAEQRFTKSESRRDVLASVRGPTGRRRQSSLRCARWTSGRKTSRKDAESSRVGMTIGG